MDTVKARKLAYYGHTMRKQGSCLEKEIMQGTMSGAQRRGRPRMACMDNIKTWTGLSVEESIRMTENRDKWRKYVYGVDRVRLKNRTEQAYVTPTIAIVFESIEGKWILFLLSCISIIAGLAVASRCQQSTCMLSLPSFTLGSVRSVFLCIFEKPSVW